MESRALVIVPLLVVSAAAALTSCSGEAVIRSPVVRVDLRDKLPRNLQRQIAAVDTSYPCSQAFTLSEGETRQRFVASYRVLQAEQARYITAVEVDPDGPTQGARAAEASAMVGELRIHQVKGEAVAEVPVRVAWRASSGCSQIAQTKTVNLRADDPACKPPAQPMKLLTPDP